MEASEEGDAATTPPLGHTADDDVDAEAVVDEEEGDGDNNNDNSEEEKEDEPPPPNARKERNNNIYSYYVAWRNSKSEDTFINENSTKAALWELAQKSYGGNSANGVF